MRRATAAVALALLLVVSGCAGLGGDTAPTPTPTATTEQATATPTPPTEQPHTTTTAAPTPETPTPTTTTTEAEADIRVTIDAPAETDSRTLSLTVTLRNYGTAAGTVNDSVTVSRVGYTQFDKQYRVTADMAPGETVTQTLEYRYRATDDYTISHNGTQVKTVEANSWTHHRTWVDRVKATIKSVFDATAEVGV